MNHPVTPPNSGNEPPLTPPEEGNKNPANTNELQIISDQFPSPGGAWGGYSKATLTIN